ESPIHLKVKSELLRFLKRGARRGSWPLLQRYAVVPKILRQPTVECFREATQSVHVLVCEKDAVMLHWCLRSLVHHASAPFTIYIHDDGTCSAETLQRFRRVFRHAIVLSRAEADAIVEPKIAHSPELLHWRRNDYIAAKCIDFYLIGQEPWLIVLDADVLFFA